MAVAHSVITGVTFSPANSDFNKQNGAVEITNFDLFAGRAPINGGVYDARMGTSDNFYSCSTCGHQRKQCVGHPGYLNLKIPVQHPLMLSDIRRWLRIVCLSCGTPMMDITKYANVPAIKRLGEAASSQTEGKTCPNCSAVHPKIIKDPEDYFSLLFETVNISGKTNEQRIHPFKLKEIFSRIPMHVVKELGRKPNMHPSNFILATIPIPSTVIRPGMKAGAKAQGYNDVNNMIQYIVKTNMTFPEQLPSNFGGTGMAVSATTIKSYERTSQNLQQLYYDFIQGTATTTTTYNSFGKRTIISGSKPAAALLRRLPRKEGRIRKDLLGCQVWCISRSTISGNNALSLESVGIPIEVARILQVKESVQICNIDRLLPFFVNGRKIYPGSTRIWKKRTNALYDVEGLKQNFKLEIGDVLYRDVIDGDFAFFNRQPSLERSSIGVHKIVVLHDPKVSTFQMNVSACNLYNADFDGDQMNLWVPHGIMSRTEAEFMCHIKNWFISTKNAGPMNGQVQDGTTGHYLLTRNKRLGKPNVMDRFHAMALYQTTKMEPPLFTKDEYAGKDLISLILKDTPINYNKPPKWYSEVYLPYIHYDQKDIETKINNGVLEQGILDKKSVGAGAVGGLYHQIARIYGCDVALNTIFGMQQIAINYVGNVGFTVGLNDMILNKRALNEVYSIISEILQESKEISRKLITGKIIPPIGSTTHQFYEKMQQNALKLPDKILGPILQSIDPDTNGLFQMVAAGAKGSNPNMIHIMAVVGQIEINTERIQGTFGFGRTLPYYSRFALEPEANGFIQNSYITGLTAPEFVYGEMNGRFDLINKALSTSSTGYANRKAVFALQSCITDYMRHITINNKIVQPIYGEDGLDARQVEWVKFKSINMDDQELEKNYRFTTKTENQKFFDKLFNAIKCDRDNFRDLQLTMSEIVANYQIMDSAQLPINIARIINGYQLKSENPESVLIQLCESVEEFIARLPYILINEIQEKQRSAIPEWIERATTFIKMSIRLELTPHILQKMTPEQLALCLNVIKLQYLNSLADYGEAVGVLAAQSVSEPLTQYMLDSHHRSVSGGTNKSGIVRPQEIFGAKSVEQEQSAEMVLSVKDSEIAKNQTQVQKIANSIEMMILRRFVKQWSLLLEEFPEKNNTPMYPGFDDLEWIRQFQNTHPILVKPTNLTNWCLRLELNKTAIILKSLSLQQIIEKLRTEYINSYIIHTPENVDQIFIRIYMSSSMFKKNTGGKITNEEKPALLCTEKILTTLLRGTVGIKNTQVISTKKININSAGKFEKQNIYGIKTVGTNIYDITLNKEIDVKNIISSSIGDTYNNYGIEAARIRIVHEIKAVMGDKSPSLRHLLLYADLMTRTGKVTSLERDGLNIREHKNVLQRMGMSAPKQVLTNAVIESTNSPVYGLAGPMILGGIPKIGTLYSDVVVNEEFLQEHATNYNKILDDI
nr:Putative DNA-directed RNA polymerase subunit [Abalone asfa-like virus]